MDRQLAKTILMERMGWDEVEFAEKETWVRENCVCGDCPSYSSDETELGFCWPSIAQSDLIEDENDCVCGQCQVFNEAALRTAYYCTRGSEVDQLVEISSEAGDAEVA